MTTSYKNCYSNSTFYVLSVTGLKTTRKGSPAVKVRRLQTSRPDALKMVLHRNNRKRFKTTKGIPEILPLRTPHVIYDRGVTPYQDTPYGYRYLKDSGVDVSSVDDETLNALMCVKANCSDHQHSSITPKVCQTVNDGVVNKETIDGEIAKENLSEVPFKEVRFDSFVSTISETPCPCGAVVCQLAKETPCPCGAVDNDEIGPPRLSSTMVESSDDEYFDSSHCSDTLTFDDSVFEDDTSDITGLQLSRWAPNIHSWSFPRFQNFGQVFEGIRNNLALVALGERPLGWFRTLGERPLGWFRTLGERPRGWFRVVTDASRHGARSAVGTVTDIGGNLNQSFMNDTLDVSDAAKNMSFSVNDVSCKPFGIVLNP